MTRQRWHVLRSEFSPTTGLRQVNLTREPVRAAKRAEALADARHETMDHMERGGIVTWRDLRPHGCLPFLCDRIEDHVNWLAWRDDQSRIITLRLVEA